MSDPVSFEAQKNHRCDHKPTNRAGACNVRDTVRLHRRCDVYEKALLLRPLRRGDPQALLCRRCVLFVQCARQRRNRQRYVSVWEHAKTCYDGKLQKAISPVRQLKAEQKTEPHALQREKSRRCFLRCSTSVRLAKQGSVKEQ